MAHVNSSSFQDPDGIFLYQMEGDKRKRRIGGPYPSNEDADNASRLVSQMVGEAPIEDYIEFLKGPVTTTRFKGTSNPWGDLPTKQEQADFRSRTRGIPSGGFDWRNIPTNIKEDAGLLFEKGKEALGGLMEHIPSAPFPTAGAATLPKDMGLATEAVYGDFYDGVINVAPEAMDWFKNQGSWSVDSQTKDLKGGRNGLALVIHHTANSRDYNPNYKASSNDVPDPFTDRAGSAGNTHFVINRDGTVYQTMETGKEADHVGKGTFTHPTLGKLDNSNTLGIEIVSYRDAEVTDAQIEAAMRLAAELGYKPEEIVGHYEWTKRTRPEGDKIISAIQGKPRKFYEEKGWARKQYLKNKGLIEAQREQGLLYGPAPGAVDTYINLATDPMDKFKRLREQLFGP